MIYKGTITIVGETDDPLPVNCEITDHRIVIKASDGSVVGDWGIREIGAEQTSDGVVLHVEGEDLLVTTRDVDAFARALRIGEASGVANRISDARESSNRERIRPVLAAGIAAGLLAGIGIAAWIVGVGPFGPDVETDRSAPASTEHVIAAVSPPVVTTQIVTTTTLSTSEKWQDFFELYAVFQDELAIHVTDMDEARDKRDFPAMGATCKLSKVWVEDWTLMFSLFDYPSYELRTVTETILDELNLAFFWCSGGDKFAMNASIPHFNVFAELLDEMNEVIADL